MSAWKQFSETEPDLFAAFLRLTNAHFTAAADEYREGASDASVTRHDDAMRAAQDAFIELLMAKFAAAKGD